MHKVLVHTETVNNKAAKLQLQIKLPKDVKCIQSITITTTGFGTDPSPKREVGWLWLRLPNHSDVFFAEIVRSNVPEATLVSSALEFLPQEIGFGEAWIDGKSGTTLAVDVSEDAKILEGFYTDRLRETFFVPYQVSIYLNLEL